MVACAESWLDKTGIQIEWEKRSLQDFESFPVDELARRYDLIVIDHPHVGQITRENCLLPLDVPDRREAIEILRHQSVGLSLESYRYAGRLWALPIDAATQVQAWRPRSHQSAGHRLGPGDAACAHRPRAVSDAAAAFPDGVLHTVGQSRSSLQCGWAGGSDRSGFRHRGLRADEGADGPCGSGVLRDGSDCRL